MVYFNKFIYQNYDPYVMCALVRVLENNKNSSIRVTYDGASYKSHITQQCLVWASCRNILFLVLIF